MVERIRAFYDDPQKIPSLASALFGRKKAAEPDGDYTPRQMRSERREACCALLGAIVHYCDLPSLCLSVPQPDGTLLPIRMDTLAERAGLSLRRAERAMRDIVGGGLLTIYPRCELQEDGSYIGRAAIRVVPAAFFGLFGLQARLEHDRQRIGQKRAQDQGGTPNRTAAARMMIGARALLDRVVGGGPASKPAAAHIPDFSSDSPPLTGPFTHSKHIDAMRAMLDDADSSRPADRTDTANRLVQPDIADGLNPFPIRCDTS
ncbi:hypothetical protein [Thiocapsa sp.]|uniref:hypothetical protein n=1 Tax=Thiocapsa sp. TaxID=2024551 RepID=UPI002B5AAD16|nr:hypothetical protein [Thiocapsa sp.]HSO82278.1 hypothetical protein [Thiocapsa sp.]